VLNGKYKSIYRAAQAFNLPNLLCMTNLKHTQSRAKAWESQQNVSASEEKALENWIIDSSQSGYSVRHAIVHAIIHGWGNSKATHQ